MIGTGLSIPQVAVRQRRGGGDAIIEWFADTGRDGLYVDGRAGEALFQDAARTQHAALGDPVGGIADLSGNGYPGAQPTTGASPLRTADGLAFDGGDDRLPFGDVLSFGAESFSALLLCNTPNDGTRHTPLSKRGSGGPATNPGWGVRLNASGVLELEFDDGSTPQGPVLALGSSGYGWGVLVVVVDRSVGIAYGRRDGLPVGQANISAFGDISGSQPLTLGAPTSSPYEYGGTLSAAVVMAGTDYQTIEQSLLDRLP